MFIGNVFNIFLWTFLFSKRQFAQGNTCPQLVRKEIVVLYKSYFDDYLTKNTSTPSEPSGLFPKMVRTAVFNCCPRIDVYFEPLADEEDIEMAAFSLEPKKWKDSYAFFFPAFVNKGKKEAFAGNLWFFPLTQSPGHAVIMRVSDYNTGPPIGAIFLSFLPGFLMMTVLAALVGTLAWFLEYRNNRLEFPAPFVLGIFEGFWWSIVTMTTVGYGDKSPKSRITRVLAFSWMIFSAIFLSLFTANASSLLTISRSQNYDNTLGAKIGALHSKAFVDSELNLGAYIKAYHNQTALMEALLNKKVNRILFPNYLDYFYGLTIPQFGKYLKSKYRIASVIHKPFDIGLVLADIHSNESDHFLQCLHFYILRSEKKLKFWNYSGIAQLQESDSAAQNGFSYDTTLVISKVSLIILGCLIVFGVAFDLSKYFKKDSNNDHLSSQKGDQETTSNNTESKPTTKEKSWFQNRIFP